MAAGVVPQSSWSLKPETPPSTCSSSPASDTVLPLPNSDTLSGTPSSARSMKEVFQDPGVTVVALVPSVGPVPPPMIVVIPVPRATSTSVGVMRWTWLSTAPAVTILPLPAMTSVDGPITRAGSTPPMVSGLPALPMPTMRPSRIPMSALMTPQWSRITAPVITTSGVPSARVATDWPIDSRMTLPPPNTASLPPPALRSRSTSISRSVSASRMRSPAVGP